jgi:2-polyprenyl-3-methyl-5-hydroxy-6-metoxy-1,4-benzoquinol methylase
MQPIVSEISRRRKLKLLTKFISPQSTVLEVGAGDNWCANNLRSLGYKVTTLDLQQPADIIGNILEWGKLGLKKNTYDVVVALELIEHVDCLGALEALCKENGFIMLSSPHPHWDWVMKILEFLHLTQKRTSAHTNLTDFRKIDLVPIVRQRPLFIHQVAIFRNQKNEDSHHLYDSSL